MNSIWLFVNSFLSFLKYRNKFQAYRSLSKYVSSKMMLLLPILLFLLLSSCKKDITAPHEDNLKPGRRDYTWEMDTLHTDGYFYIQSMWGADPNNLWAVGLGGGPWDCMWHYDGNKWKRDNPTISSVFNTVFGFSANDIWAGDGNGTFYKFNGQWEVYQTLTKKGFNHFDINCIWGTSSNNLFFCGTAANTEIEGRHIGIIGKFNGTTWEMFNIPEISTGFHNIKIQQSTGLAFLEALEFKDGIFTEMLFVYDFKEIKLIASGNKGYYQLGYIDGEVYFNINQKIFKYIKNKLVLWKDFTNSQFLGVLIGRSEKDFFSIGKNGEILQFNGENWAAIFQKESFDYFAWYFLDNNFYSFIVDLETNERFMLRGTLK